MNLGMYASTIRMPFFFKNFNSLEKVSTKREGQQKFGRSVYALTSSNGPVNYKWTGRPLKQSLIVLSYIMIWCSQSKGSSD